MILDLVYLLNALAWPAAVSFAVFRLTKAWDEHSKRMAAELGDANYLETKAVATQATRELQEARDEWARVTATTQEELSELKGALINRA